MSFGHLEEEKAYMYYFPCTAALCPLTPSLLHVFSLSPTAMPSVVLLCFHLLTCPPSSPSALSHPSLQPAFPLFNTLLLSQASKHPISWLFDPSLFPVSEQQKPHRGMLGSTTAALVERGRCRFPHPDPTLAFSVPSFCCTYHPCQGNAGRHRLGLLTQDPSSLCWLAQRTRGRSAGALLCSSSATALPRLSHPLCP